jgi:hypothetical protein
LLGDVEATTEFIARFPEAGVRIPDVPDDLPVRRAAVRRFPFHLVYIGHGSGYVKKAIQMIQDWRAVCIIKARIPIDSGNFLIRYREMPARTADVSLQLQCHLGGKVLIVNREAGVSRMEV